jgi:hypothetical protein
MVRWKQRRLTPKMPFPKGRGGIALGSTQFGDGQFVEVQPGLGIGTECATDPDPIAVAAGQDRGSRSRTHRLGHIELGEQGSVPRHLVDVWGLPPRLSVGG